jgi:hypothetical protein
VKKGVEDGVERREGVRGILEFTQMATGTPIPTRKLTASDLLLRGLFRDRIIPPLSSSSLQPAITDLSSFAAQDVREANGRRVPRVTSLCSRHSVPKQKLAKRFLGIPNPRNHMLLAIEIFCHRQWNGT